MNEEYDGVWVTRLPSTQEYIGAELRKTLEAFEVSKDEKVRELLERHANTCISIEEKLNKILEKQLIKEDNAERSAIGNNVLRMPGAAEEPAGE